MSLNSGNDAIAQLLSGFVYIFHPAAPGSSPKHTIYAFINLYLNYVLWKIGK